jgi:hypothetical protein
VKPSNYCGSGLCPERHHTLMNTQRPFLAHPIVLRTTAFRQQLRVSGQVADAAGATHLTQTDLIARRLLDVTTYNLA